MVGELVTLPLRIGVRATRAWLHAAEGAVSATASAAEALLDVVTSRRRVRGPDPRDLTPPHEVDPVAERQPSPTEARPQAEPEGVRPEPERPSAAPAKAQRQPPTDAPTAPTISEERGPAHVSEEPVLVEEFAEPGAEDGAGAQVDVEEPWSGYDQMNAKEVISRLAGATSAELAAVELYESGHRRRQTILTAVGRELQSANGGGR